jgi:hypothetical protein
VFHRRSFFHQPDSHYACKGLELYQLIITLPDARNALEGALLYLRIKVLPLEALNIKHTIVFSRLLAVKDPSSMLRKFHGH